jgi:hypothetical protein
LIVDWLEFMNEVFDVLGFPGTKNSTMRSNCLRGHDLKNT